MRIASVCADPGISVFGWKGASIHVQEVARALRRRGAAVELFATRADGEVPADLADVPVHPLPSIPKGSVPDRERRARRANIDLRIALERAGPFDAVYERYSLWSVAGMAFARAAGVPGLLEVNAPLIDEQARHRGLADRAAAERTATAVFGLASAVLAVSRPVAEWAARYGALGHRVHVVPNGVDPARFGQHRPPADGFTIGFVGTLKPWHGVEVLVDAAALLRPAVPALRLRIVGDGPQRDALARRVADRGLIGITTFTGAVAPWEIPGELARMHVGVVPCPPGLDCYFSPLKLYEYLAAGLPVVASRVGQAAEVIDHGHAGLLVDPGDAGALAAALARLYADPALRAALGRAGRAQAVARHSWDTVAGRILELASARAVIAG